MSVSIMHGNAAYPLAGAKIYRGGVWRDIKPTDEIAANKKLYVVGGNNVLCSRGYYNEYGQLGTGDYNEHYNWTTNRDPSAIGYERMEIVNLFNCTKVATDGLHYSVAIAGGKLYGWGSMHPDEKINTPTLLSDMTGWTDVCVCWWQYFTGGVKNGYAEFQCLTYGLGICNGELYGWGYRALDGTYTEPYDYYPVPVKVSEETGWSAIGAVLGVCNGKLYELSRRAPLTVTRVGALADWSWVSDQWWFAIRGGQLYTINHDDTVTQIGTSTGWTMADSLPGQKGFGICNGDLMLWNISSQTIPAPVAVPSAVKFKKVVPKGSASAYLLGTDDKLYHLANNWDGEPEVYANHDGHEWLDIAAASYLYYLAIRTS